MTLHTDTTYEAELIELNVRFNRMSLFAGGMVRHAMRALSERDATLARQVVADDVQVDQMEIEIDRRCLHILARRAPVGADLRVVIAILKAVTDVERVGDLAVNIAERALVLLTGQGLEPPAEIGALYLQAVALYTRALDAFRQRDALAARGLPAADREVDALNRAAFQRLYDLGHDFPDQFDRVMALSSICRHLERVGDHAVNLGECAVFLVEGEDVRHGG